MYQLSHDETLYRISVKLNNLRQSYC